MEKKKAAPQSTAPKTHTYYSTDTQTQNKRLIEALKTATGKGLTSYQVREHLDIYSPTARITELRKAGNDIRTLREKIDTGKGLHSVARWVLISAVGVAA